MVGNLVNLVKVLIVFDSVSVGSCDDVIGDVFVACFSFVGFEMVERRVVPDDVGEITNALSYMAYGFNGLVLTTGGAGFGQRDFTPEATKRILDRDAPGMAEAMRMVSPRGRLSRAIAGTRGSALILNLAAAPDRALEMLEAVIDVVPETLRLLAGGVVPTVDALQPNLMD